MTSYKELLMQREALEQQINEARRNELANAVSQVRALGAEYGLTARDIFPTSKFLSGGRIPGARPSRGARVAPKSREPATGQTWTARGKAPKWIQNEDRAKFAI